MSTGIKPPFDFAELNSKLSISVRRGFVDAARRTATPHIVQQNGLCEDMLGQRCYYEQREERRHWIAQHCWHTHEIEPIRDARIRLTGFVFRFADPDEAFAFRMRF
ncbi:hypothetical protein ACRBEV_01840 [Methylobacterium phyllosphaerae]